MEAVFLKVLNMGFTASWLILAVLFIRMLLKKAPKWISCLLWALVAFKLVCPFSIESALSLIPSSEPLPDRIITDNRFQVNTGTGAAAEELHVLQQYDTGTLSESRFSLEDYEALLGERIDWHFDEETRELVLTDRETEEELAAVTVPEESGEKVTGLELGMISGFELGDRIYFHVSPGYYLDDRIGIAEYEELPELRFELVMTQGEYGEVKFALGKRI